MKRALVGVVLVAAICRGEDLADLLSQLRSGTPEVRARAAAVLGRHGTPPAVGALRDALEDDAAEVRHAAAVALLQLGRADARIVPILAESLESGEWYTRWQACLLLRRLGEHAAEAVPALTRALRSDTADVLREATLALAEIDRTRKEVVLAFLAALAKANEDDQVVLMHALRGIRALPKEPAIEAMVHVLRGRATRLHAAAWKKLEQFDRPSELVLVRLLSAADTRVRGIAFERLGGYQPIVLDCVRKAIAHDEARVRVAGVAALWEFDHRHVPDSDINSVGQLIETLPTGVRRRTLEELGRFARKRPWVELYLRPQLEAEDPWVRIDALRAYARAGRRMHLQIPRLLRLVADPEPRARQEALRTLRFCGAGSLANLLATYRHKDELVVELNFNRFPECADFEALHKLLTAPDQGEKILDALESILTRNPIEHLEAAHVRADDARRDCAILIRRRFRDWKPQRR